MKNILWENLNENEFEELISILPREILIAPFINNPKRFSEYFRGFRPANIPEFKIKIAYKKLVYKKIDEKLTDYICKEIEKYIKKYIDQHIGNELLNKLRDLSYTNNDLLRVIDIFYDNKIKLNIFLYLKIHEINLTEESVNFIKDEINNRLKEEEIANRIKIDLEKKYNDLLKKKNDEVKDLIRQAVDKVEIKYNRLIEEIYSKTKNMMDEIIKEKEAIEKEYLDSTEKIVSLNKTIDDLNNIIKQKEDIIRNCKDDIKRAEKIIEHKENQIIELSNKLEKLQSLKISDLIDKETINSIITSIGKIEGKEKLKEYYESYKNDTKDSCIKDIWHEWISYEKLTIDEFFDIVLNEKELTASKIEKIDDIIYSLDLRIMLIKLLESISYKYLGMQKYNEAFK